MQTLGGSVPKIVVAAAAAAWLLVVAQVAGASEVGQPAQASLNIAPALEGCVSEAELRSQVHEALGRSVFESDTSEHTANVAVTVAGGEGEHSARIELLNPENGASLGTRSLQADSCKELVDTLSLTLSLMLDFNVEEIAELEEQARRAQTTPDVESSPTGPGEVTVQEPEASDKKPAEAPEQQPAPPAKPQQKKPKPPAKPAPAPVQDSSGHPRWLMGLEGRLGWGLSPDTSIGAGLTVGGELSRTVLLEVATGYWLEERFERQGGEITLARQDLRLTLCPLRHFEEPWSARLCANTEAATLQAASTGFTQEARASGLAFALGASLDLRYVVASPLFLRAFAAGAASLLRARLVADRDGTAVELFEMAPASGNVGFGVGLRL